MELIIKEVQQACQTMLDSQNCSKWFYGAFGKIYLRNRNYYIKNVSLNFLVFSNLSIKPDLRGCKILTTMVDDLIKRNVNLYFEGVENPRLADYLTRCGFQLDLNDHAFNSFYKLGCLNENC